ncbi:hypothetical protein Plhal304r1_c002g0005591 [Plasmopara halstedii]
MSSCLDPSVAEDFRQQFESRRISIILRSPHDSYFALLCKCTSTCLSPELPQNLQPDRGIRHKIEIEPDAEYMLLRQWLSPAEQSEIIDSFFAAKQQNGKVRGSQYPYSAPMSCARIFNSK